MKSFRLVNHMTEYLILIGSKLVLFEQKQNLISLYSRIKISFLGRNCSNSFRFEYVNNPKWKKMEYSFRSSISLKFIFSQEVKMVKNDRHKWPQKVITYHNLLFRSLFNGGLKWPQRTIRHKWYTVTRNKIPFFLVGVGTKF